MQREARRVGKHPKDSPNREVEGETYHSPHVSEVREKEVDNCSYFPSGISENSLPFLSWPQD